MVPRRAGTRPVMGMGPGAAPAFWKDAMRHGSVIDGLPAARIDVVEGDRGLTLTHRPSGDSVLRPMFVEGAGTASWMEELVAFLARHPRDLPLYDASGDCLGHARDLPAAGGGFEPGDLVVTVGGPASRRVMSAFEDGPPTNRDYDLADLAYRLEDGTTLRYAQMQGTWVARDAGGTVRAARRPLPGEDAVTSRIAPVDALLAGLDAARGMFRPEGPVYVAVDEAPTSARRGLYARMRSVEVHVEAQEGALGADPSPGTVPGALVALVEARDLLAEIEAGHAAAYPSRRREVARIAMRRQRLDAVVEGLRERGIEPGGPGPGM